MKSKILIVGEKIDEVKSGADQVNKRNQMLLERICSVTYISPKRTRMGKLYFGISNSVLLELQKELSSSLYDYIFVEQSLQGRICKYVKTKFPKIVIIAFFHNIEVQYASEYLKTRGAKAIPFYMLVKYWERQTCRFADWLITLNERDSFLLCKIYKRKSKLELPTSFSDIFDDVAFQKENTLSKEQQIDYLFVGVSFFANVDGVQWFISQVMPKVKGQLYIVGKGMDKVEFEDLSSRIHVFGFVEDLSKFYYRAKVVISPIRVGGGMKTKTAEALMYGKTILGTSEAFEGYKIDDRCMTLCNTADDFVRAINFQEEKSQLLNNAARQLFLDNYCNSKALEKLEMLFK